MNYSENNGNVYRWTFSSCISAFGDMFTSTAIPLLTYQITASPQFAVLVFMMDLFASVIISPFVGIIVDKYSKKHLVITANIISAIVICIMLIINNCWGYLIGNMLLSMLSEIYGTTAKVMIPFLVSDKNLFTRVNAKISLALKMSRIFGASTATIFVSCMNIGVLFICDIVSFVIAALITSTVWIKEDKTDLLYIKGTKKERIFRELYIGAKITRIELKKKNFWFSCIWYLAFILVEAIFNSQLVVLVKNDFNMSDTYYSLIKNFIVIGVLVAQFVIGKVITSCKEDKQIGIAVIAYIISILLLIITKNYLVALSIGFCQPFAITNWYTAFYKNVSKENLGIVLSYLSMVANISTLVVLGGVLFLTTIVKCIHIIFIFSAIIAICVLGSMIYAYYFDKEGMDIVI